MPSTPQWSLVAGWVVVGAVAGVALANPFCPAILLLVPVGVATAWLLWNVESGREPAAFLVGAVSCPLLLAGQALHPDCPVGGEFAGCEPGAVWPWLTLTVLLAVTGVVLLVTPVLRRATGVATEPRGPAG